MAFYDVVEDRIMINVILPILSKTDVISKSVQSLLTDRYGSIDGYAKVVISAIKNKVVTKPNVVLSNNKIYFKRYGASHESMVEYMESGYKDFVGIYSPETYDKINALTVALLSDNKDKLRMTRRLVLSDNSVRLALSELKEYYSDNNITYDILDDYPVPNKNLTNKITTCKESLSDIRSSLEDIDVTGAKLIDSVSNAKLVITKPTNADLIAIAGNAINNHPGYGYAMLRRATPIHVTWKSKAVNRYAHNVLTYSNIIKIAKGK